MFSNTQSPRECKSIDFTGTRRLHPHQPIRIFILPSFLPSSASSYAMHMNTCQACTSVSRRTPCSFAAYTYSPPALLPSRPSYHPFLSVRASQSSCIRDPPPSLAPFSSAGDEAGVAWARLTLKGIGRALARTRAFPLSPLRIFPPLPLLRPPSLLLASSQITPSFFPRFGAPLLNAHSLVRVRRATPIH